MADNVAILSANALLHLDGDLSIVKVTNGAIRNSGSYSSIHEDNQTKTLRHALSKRSVAVSRNDLQLVAAGNEMVLDGAGVETRVTMRQHAKRILLAGTVQVGARNAQRLLILRPSFTARCTTSTAKRRFP